jgi:hypothetical protein
VHRQDDMQSNLPVDADLPAPSGPELAAPAAQLCQLCTLTLAPRLAPTRAKLTAVTTKHHEYTIHVGWTQHAMSGQTAMHHLLLLPANGCYKCCKTFNAAPWCSRHRMPV